MISYSILKIVNVMLVIAFIGLYDASNSGHNLNYLYETTKNNKKFIIQNVHWGVFINLIFNMFLSKWTITLTIIFPK